MIGTYHERSGPAEGLQADLQIAPIKKWLPTSKCYKLEKDEPGSCPPSAGGSPGGRPEINSVQGTHSIADLLLDLTQDHEA